MEKFHQIGSFPDAHLEPHFYATTSPTESCALESHNFDAFNKYDHLSVN